MGNKEIIDYLQKELPDFNYIDGSTTKHEENWNSILVTRDGQELILDVSKVETDRHLENLRAYLKSLWSKVEV